MGQPQFDPWDTRAGGRKTAPPSCSLTPLPHAAACTSARTDMNAKTKQQKYPPTSMARPRPRIAYKPTGDTPIPHSQRRYKGNQIPKKLLGVSLCSVAVGYGGSFVSLLHLQDREGGPWSRLSLVPRKAYPLVLGISANC